MPNGGSDCCGTCWFNVRNRGEAGYNQLPEPGPDRCQIRGLEVENAYYTYCANHPHKTRGERIAVPVGPVFTDEDRFLLARSPDTEEVRAKLLELLAAMPEEPTPTYPAGWSLDDTIVWQLGEFREPRALTGLERVWQFDRTREGGLTTTATGGAIFCRNQAHTVALATLALAKILPPESVAPAWLEWNSGAVRQIARSIRDDKRMADLPILADALQEAGCTDERLLGHCRTPGHPAGGCWIVEVLLGSAADHVAACLLAPRLRPDLESLEAE
jgi:hypothetical protein